VYRPSGIGEEGDVLGEEDWEIIGSGDREIMEENDGLGEQVACPDHCYGCGRAGVGLRGGAGDYKSKLPTRTEFYGMDEEDWREMAEREDEEDAEEDSEHENDTVPVDGSHKHPETGTPNILPTPREHDHLTILYAKKAANPHFPRITTHNNLHTPQQHHLTTTNLSPLSSPTPSLKAPRKLAARSTRYRTQYTKHMSLALDARLQWQRISRQAALKAIQSDIEWFKQEIEGQARETEEEAWISMAEEQRYRRAVRFVVEGVLANSGEESGSGSSDQDGGVGERGRSGGGEEGRGFSGLDGWEEEGFEGGWKEGRCGDLPWSLEDKPCDTDFSHGDNKEEVSSGMQTEMEMPPDDVSEVPRKEEVEVQSTKRWNERIKLDALTRRCYRGRFLKRAD
jgi:hypothetical protein